MTVLFVVMIRVQGAQMRCDDAYSTEQALLPRNLGRACTDAHISREHGVLLVECPMQKRATYKMSSRTHMRAIVQVSLVFIISNVAAAGLRTLSACDGSWAAWCILEIVILLLSIIINNFI